jgi:hypothetical protein
MFHLSVSCFADAMLSAGREYHTPNLLRRRTSMAGASLERAADYIWRNARLIERLQFAFEFAHGSAEAVIAALRPYQNADGGFGNALEPDMRTPESQPASTVFALEILDATGWDRAIASRVEAWLPSITTAEGGIPWVLPSVEQYPCADWWKGGDPTRPSLGQTAATAALLIKNGHASAWTSAAAACCWNIIDVEGSDDYEFHQLRAAGALLARFQGDARAERAADRIAEHVRGHNMVERVEDAGPYAKTPVMWAPTPDSFWTRLFTDSEIDTALDGLASRQEADGSWPLGFPLTTPACEHEWRGRFTLDALHTLKAYERIN